MIRLICFIARKPGLGRREFLDHWRTSHGPLIKSLPALSRYVTRYEQNHPLESSVSHGPQSDIDRSEFDGATIMEFDSMADYQAFATHPLYSSEVAVDEARFMDRAKTCYFFSDAPILKIGDDESMASANVRLLALLKRKEGMGADAFHSHWSGPHANLFKNTPALFENILAYQQSHRSKSDYLRDPTTKWDGLAEQSYASLENFLAGAGGAPFEAVIAPDEERFLDRTATRFILCSPAEVILG